MLKGQGGGSLFVKTHPKSTHLYVDTPLNPDPKISQSVAVFDIGNPDGRYLVLPIAEWAGLGEGPKRSCSRSSTRPATRSGSRCGAAREEESAIVVVDDKTLQLKAVIRTPAPWSR